MIYIDRKFVLLISNRLERFVEKKSNLFNFRCPLCGDSQKNTRKCRGYVYEKKNRYYFKCQNCAVGLTFSDFLKQINPTLHKEYCYEKFKDSNSARRTMEPKPEAVVVFPKNPIDKALTGIKFLSDDHYAKQYIKSRLIPESRWGEIAFAPDFKKFMDETYPGHGKELYNEPRIVTFFTGIAGNRTHVCGRALQNVDNKLRYIKIRIDQNAHFKAFGMGHVDWAKKVHIVEGQFDSMFIDNALAAGDSALYQLADHLQEVKDNPDITLVYDNEPRNKEICHLQKEAMGFGYPVVIWPSNIKEKDINEMIQDGGREPSMIKKIIEENTFTGLAAHMRFVSWKKC